MTKISNQRAYIPDEEINGLDYLPGTDFDQALKTVNFRVQDLGTHYNQVNGVRNFDFNFYAHSEPTAKPINGYFYSNSNEKNPNNIEYFIFSKVTASGKIVGTFFEGLVSENPFDLTISQKVDVNSTFYFKIDSVESFTHYYKVNVSEIYFPPINLMEYTISFNVFYLKSSGVSQHNNLLGLNEGDYIHLTALEKAKFNALPDSFATKTSDLTNDGADSTSTYVETDELGVTAFSNDYNDLDNKPTIPTVITNHSGLSLDDGTNPHGTTKQDVGLGDVPNLDTTNAVNNEHTHSNKTILDNTTESFITALKNAYDGAVSWITTNGTNLINHLNNISNPHNVTKSQVGLGSVDNTSDVNKPISSATQTALNLKQDIKQEYIVNITTPSPNHTGTSAETNITSYNFVIPANTLSNGDTLRIENMLWEKIGILNTSNCRLKLSNTNNFATANQVAIFFNSSANIYMRACRTFNINSGLLRGVSFTANAIFNDFTLTNLGFSSLALDFTQPIYGFISLQLTNPADIILMRELKIRKI